MRKIIITIDPTGEDTRVLAEGFAGQGCQSSTRPYQQALGQTVSDESTPEMFASEQVSDELTQ